MVCSFFFLVLPALLWKAMSWIWAFFTGKKQMAPQPEGQDAEVPAVVKKGVCPYHVVLKFFGFKVPETEVAAPLAAEPQPAGDNRVKAE